MASADQTLIRMTNVTKQYGKDYAVQIDSLELVRHQLVLLKGENGSGKSTLLRILGRISTIDSGELWYNAVFETRRLGFVPQSGGIYGQLTLRRNLNLRRHLYGLPPTALTDLWYLDEFDLGRFIDKPVDHLSGGYQRLAALATTLHCDPHWLLLDEPFAAIDDGKKELLRERLSELSHHLDLCVVASPSDHDLGYQQRFFIEEGRLV